MNFAYSDFVLSKRKACKHKSFNCLLSFFVSTFISTFCLVMMMKQGMILRAKAKTRRRRLRGNEGKYKLINLNERRVKQIGNYKAFWLLSLISSPRPCCLAKGGKWSYFANLPINQGPSLSLTKFISIV